LTPIFLVAALILSAAPAMAQNGEEEEELPLNFVFATQLGSGIYEVGGRTVQVYRIPLSQTIRKLKEDRKWGLKLKFPLTFGFADFNLEEIIESGLPDNVETVSLVPGVEFQVPVGKHWLLKPYVEAGAGKHFSGGQLTWVYSGGIKSEGIYPTKSFTYFVTAQMLYAGQFASKTEEGTGFSVFRLGFDARHPLWFSFGGGKATGGLYARSFLYFDKLSFTRLGREPVEFDKQWEVGLTIGRPKPFKWWWINIKHPRFGLGYRWGKDFWAVRLVLGNPI